MLIGGQLKLAFAGCRVSKPHIDFAPFLFLLPLRWYSLLAVGISGWTFAPGPTCRTPYPFWKVRDQSTPQNLFLPHL
jgi:hypothetical protein